MACPQYTKDLVKSQLGEIIKTLSSFGNFPWPSLPFERKTFTLSYMYYFWWPCSWEAWCCRRWCWLGPQPPQCAAATHSWSCHGHLSWGFLQMILSIYFKLMSLYPRVSYPESGQAGATAIEIRWGIISRSGSGSWHFFKDEPSTKWTNSLSDNLCVVYVNVTWLTNGFSWKYKEENLYVFWW